MTSDSIRPGGEVPPLVVHVIYRMAVGGLENGLVNLLNRMDPGAYRHAVIVLTEVTDFSKRVESGDVAFYALQKGQGHAVALYPRLYRLFDQLRPAVVHTRNLAALEAIVPAWAAGVRVRIHGEHGRDIADPDGSNRKYQLMRRLYRPFVSRYIALSRDLADYLRLRVGVSASRIEQIYNGVDTQNFRPARASDEPVPGMPFDEPGLWLVGTVGRMQQVKDQTNLARAFVQAVSASAEAARRLRLVMVGDGPLRAEAAQILEAAGVSGLAWLPGERADVGQIMRRLDCFVLPSIGEGISNTILEAMASALPVIATAVGGNVELVRAGTTGMLVPAQNSVAMSEAILGYFADTDLARKHGCAGRALVERRFSLDAMVDRYQAVYDGMLGIRRRSTDTQLGRSEQLQG